MHFNGSTKSISKQNTLHIKSMTIDDQHVEGD